MTFWTPLSAISSLLFMCLKSPEALRNSSVSKRMPIILNLCVFICADDTSVYTSSSKMPRQRLLKRHTLVLNANVCLSFAYFCCNHTYKSAGQAWKSPPVSLSIWRHCSIHFCAGCCGESLAFDYWSSTHKLRILPSVFRTIAILRQFEKLTSSWKTKTFL